MAPGQLLKHYSPNVDCFLLVDQLQDPRSPTQAATEERGYNLADSAIIDFHGHNLALKDKCKLYRDLSASGSFKEALFNLYLLLRECEISEGVKSILVRFQEEGFEEGSFGSTLFDKIFRSAAGVKASLSPEGALTFNVKTTTNN